MNEIKKYLVEFNEEYFIKYLREDKSDSLSKLNMESCLEHDLDFDWEAYDYFIGELANRYDIDISNFFLNTHTRGMSYELRRLPTKLFLPLIGLKKWMVFDDVERIPLQIKHIVQAMKSKELNSKIIYESININESQKKVRDNMKVI